MNLASLPRKEREKLARALQEQYVRQQRRIQAGEGGLIAFVRYFWRVLEPVTPFVDGWALEAMCEHLEAVTDGRITRLLINVPPGFMKALDIETPILTTWGWKKHGDLRVGDYVFGPDGEPKKVLACTDHADEESYDVKFDDGVAIIAGAGHLWAIEREYSDKASKWHRTRRSEVVTTPELQVSSRTHKGGTSPDLIRVAKAIRLPPRQLLIDPYVFGAWLGDGSTTAGCIYAAEQDIENFAKLGRIAHTVPAGGMRNQAFHRIAVDGLQVRLRILGLLGNKHIPEDYLQSSIDQRLALLQGLMDTDGNCAKTGECSFTTSLPSLRDGVKSLIESLGMKAYCSSRLTKLNGKIYGPHYKIGFTPEPGMRIFRLDRKQAMIKSTDNPRSRSRYIDRVTPVGKRTVNCIQVEGGLYLAGLSLVPTHNSMLLNIFWPAWEWGAKARPDLRYVSFSYSSILTERDNEKFHYLLASPEYQALYGRVVKITKEGVGRIANTARGWKFASSVGGVGTGERGDRILADDLHKVSEAESETVREATTTWFRESMQNRLNDLGRGAIIVLGQRVNGDDVSGVIIEEYPDYVHLCIPMEYDARDLDEDGFKVQTSIGWEDERTDEGQLAWPERYPGHVLEAFKSRPYLWAGQYQQSPTIRGGAIIRNEYWRIWNAAAMAEHDVKLGSFPPLEFVIASLDGAFTEKKENDWSALTVWGVWLNLQGDPKVILMDAWHKRLSLHGTSELVQMRGETGEEFKHRQMENWGIVEHVAATCKKHKIDKLIIEAKGPGYSVAQEMRRLYSREPWVVQLYDPGQMDKVARVWTVQHLFTDGMIWRPETEWARMVEDEFGKFPKGAHDDLVDSGVQALTVLRRSGFASRVDEAHAALEEMLYPSRPPSKILYHS